MSASTVSMLPGVTRAWEHKPCNKSEGAWEEWTGAGWQLDQENVPLQASAVAEARTDVHPSRMGHCTGRCCYTVQAFSKQP